MRLFVGQSGGARIEICEQEPKRHQSLEPAVVLLRAPSFWEPSVVRKTAVCPVAAAPFCTAATVNCFYCCRWKDPRSVGLPVVSTVSCLLCPFIAYCIFVTPFVGH